MVQATLRVQHEKIDAHGTPVHLAQRGNSGLGLHAPHVKTQPIAQLQVQGFGNTFFDADGIRLFIAPAPCHHVIVLWQRGIERHVELPIQQTPGHGLAHSLRAQEQHGH